MISPLPGTVIAACLIFGSLVLIELRYQGNDVPAVEQTSPQAEVKLAPRREKEPRADDLAATALAAPLFSPARRPPEVSGTAEVDSGLSQVRLTGIVIEPDRRLAIFAISGEKPLAVAEGEGLKEWRLDSISPEKVSLSGPNGIKVLEPKPDANLVRPRPPAPPQPKPGAPVAAVPGQPSPTPPQTSGAAPPVPPQIRFPANLPARTGKPVRSP